MNKLHATVLALAAFAALSPLCVPAAENQKAEVALKAAMDREVLDGDLKGAIEQYMKLAQSANRAVAAAALVRMGQCYEKLGDTEARKAYERVVKEYADQREPLSQARQRLVALGGSTSAARGVGMHQFFDPKTHPNRDVWNVSSDGRYGAATDYTGGNAAVVDLTTGKSWNVTDYGIWNDEKGYMDQSAISRDGKQLAFWHYKAADTYGQLRVVGTDGKNERTLYSTQEEKGDEEWGIATDWSPDGRQIAMQLERSIKGSLTHGVTEFMLVPAAGGSPRVLKTAEFTNRYRPKILFSPDGRYVAYDYPPNKQVAEGDIFVVPAEGGQETAIAPHPARDTLVAWAPDGSILFLSDRSGSIGLYRVAIKDGKQAGEPELLRAGIGEISALGVTKSGALHYSQEILATNAFIASLDFATGKLLSPPERVTRRLNDSTSTPSWSADGRKLAYVKLRQDGGMPTVVIREDGAADERELLPAVRLERSGAGHHAFMVRWHADGRSLLAIGSKDNKEGLYRIDAATGEAVLVQEGWLTEWSPDGKWTFGTFDQGGEKRRIVRKDTATGEKNFISTVSPRWDLFRVSPDGRRLAFLQMQPKNGQLLSVVSIDGGTLIPLVAHDDKQPWFSWLAPATAWSPDGRFLFFLLESHAPEHGADGGELWVVPAEGGEARKTELTSHDAFLGELNIHPDGKRIGYSVKSWKTEYWVLENFLPGLAAAK